MRTRKAFFATLLKGRFLMSSNVARRFFRFFRWIFARLLFVISMYSLAISVYPERRARRAALAGVATRSICFTPAVRYNSKEYPMKRIAV